MQWCTHTHMYIHTYTHYPHTYNTTHVCVRSHTHTHTHTRSVYIHTHTHTGWQCEKHLTYSHSLSPHTRNTPTQTALSDLFHSWRLWWPWRFLCCRRSGWAPDQSERTSAANRDRPAGTEPAPHGTRLHTDNNLQLQWSMTSSGWECLSCPTPKVYV